MAGRNLRQQRDEERRRQEALAAAEAADQQADAVRNYDKGQGTHAPEGHRLYRRRLFDVIFRGMEPQRWQEPWVVKAESSSPTALAAALRRIRSQSRGQSLMAALLAPKAPTEPKAPSVPPTPSLLAGT